MFSHTLEERVALRDHTTLRVGGPARYFLSTNDVELLARTIAEAHEANIPLLVLGQGSNVVVADDGWPGLAVRYTASEMQWQHAENGATVTADAGLLWDTLVDESVAQGLGGIECLSGIPGTVGAAPVQNVGAYGQEVAETIKNVTVLHLPQGQREVLSAATCGFAYRQSNFKTIWQGEYLITGVTLALTVAKEGVVRYPQLAEALGDKPHTLDNIRTAVLALRQSKSMVLSADDPNSRSVGSFFMNPVVSVVDAATIAERVGSGAPPQWLAGDGQVKLSAAWLIEAAGFARGDRRGGIALSDRHVLALVNTGEGTAKEVVAFAREIRQRVFDLCGVVLVPEPRFFGFSEPGETLLAITKT